MTAQASLMWFRQDLRLRDNPALTAAANSGPILPVYILDDTNSAPWQLGAASRWWLHQSLNALNMQLNNRLMVLRGDPRKLIPALAADYGIEKIFWNQQREIDLFMVRSLHLCVCQGIDELHGLPAIGPPDVHALDGVALVNEFSGLDNERVPFVEILALRGNSPLCFTLAHVLGADFGFIKMTLHLQRHQPTW